MIKITQDSEHYTISDGKGFDLGIDVNRKDAHIALENSRGHNEFIFNTKLKIETLQRWEKVCKLLLRGIRYIKSKEYGKR